MLGKKIEGFQVPKGMLQTISVPANSSIQLMFQVPKGMLQTCVLLFQEGFAVWGFKSPRECYKLLSPISISSFVILFQVPKGMLQTFRSSQGVRKNEEVSSPQGNATNLPLSPSRSNPPIKSFKSPRECYKRNATLSPWAKDSGFQVPKGMLQTMWDSVGMPCWEDPFQVPKGMLQTQVVKDERFAYLLFQVPKGMLQTDSYAPKKHWMGAMFQVPKGMLQTLNDRVYDMGY